MPSINPNLIPLVSPGSLFDVLTTNNSLAVRWLVATDPHYFDVYNRPLADITVRQLIIAKSIDQIELRLGHQALFPFIVPATLDVASSTISLPLSWLWDCHVSLHSKYTGLRLAQIKRISGTNNPSSDTFTGVLRLVFTANLNNGVTEIGIFTVDYQINSSLAYQIKAVAACTTHDFTPALPTEEAGSIAGYVIFRTLSLALGSPDEMFLSAIQPPVGGTAGSDGIYVNPTVYDITDTTPGGPAVTDDFSLPAISHGTGTLVASAYVALPPVEVDAPSILSALNYPWRIGTSLVSLDNLSTVPNNLFSTFSMTAPMGDRNTTQPNPYPVYLTKVRRLDSLSNNLELTFSTNTTAGGSTSTGLLEFATLVLSRSNFGTSGPDTQLRISSISNLIDGTLSDHALFTQNFGSGFVTLSANWASDASIIAFFDSFVSLLDNPPVRYFKAELGEFALQRSPAQVPTSGQFAALVGSTARLSTPITPSDTNRFVTEADQGLGDKVNFITSGFTHNDDIDDVGYTGALLSKTIVLKVNTSNNANFTYQSDILPRLIKLLGRQPIFGDIWFDGTTFKRYDGSVWIEV